MANLKIGRHQANVKLSEIFVYIKIQKNMSLKTNKRLNVEIIQLNWTRMNTWLENKHDVNVIV